MCLTIESFAIVVFNAIGELSDFGLESAFFLFELIFGSEIFFPHFLDFLCVIIGEVIPEIFFSLELIFQELNVTFKLINFFLFHKSHFFLQGEDFFSVSFLLFQY